MHIYHVLVWTDDPREGPFSICDEYYYSERLANQRLSDLRQRHKNNDDLRIYYNFRVTQHNLLLALP